MTNFSASTLWRSSRGVLFALGLGVAGAIIFRYLDLPLPWMLGPLALCLVAGMAKGPIEKPDIFQVPARLTLGVAVGTAFTPELAARIPEMVVSLALVLPFITLTILLSVPYFHHVARFNRPTAFFAAVPGGLQDMVIMAEDAGANVRIVALVQSTRVLLLVFALPFWIEWSGGVHIGSAAITKATLFDITIFDAIAAISIGVAGWLAASALKLTGASLIGPMIASAIFHVAGFGPVQVPNELINMAQLILGVQLGCLFKGTTLRELVSPVSHGILFSLLLLVITACFTFAITATMDFDSTSVLLAFSPGGQSEVNLIAFVLGLDVAYVALHHLARIAIVIIGAQIILKSRLGQLP